MKRRVFMGLIGLPLGVLAQDSTVHPGKIIAMDPPAIVHQATNTLSLRGFHLKDATGLTFPHATGVSANIQEAKDAGSLAGLDNKTIGDTELTIELILTGVFSADKLEFVVVTPSGEIGGGLPVLAPCVALNEQEPNNGFREAQLIQPGQIVRGAIQSDRDVDVYSYTGIPDQKLKISVQSGGSPILDAVLNCFDFRGNFLAASDDTESRDPSLLLTVPDDQPLYFSVSSAHDTGGKWHGYLLIVEGLEVSK